MEGEATHAEQGEDHIRNGYPKDRLATTRLTESITKQRTQESITRAKSTKDTESTIEEDIADTEGAEDIADIEGDMEDTDVGMEDTTKRDHLLISRTTGDTTTKRER